MAPSGPTGAARATRAVISTATTVPGTGGGVEREPHLIGGRVVTRHAIQRRLRIVQLDQVFHLPALAVDVLVKVLCGALTEVTT
jgi:hypothetical protein